MKDTYPEVETPITQTKDRAQKIVAALYLLTNHIDIENPIRTEIRATATQLLKAVLFASKIDDLKNTILSFLSVAVLTKEISPENASILENELNSLKIQYTQMSEPVLSQLFVHSKERVLSEGKETKDTQSINAPKSADVRIQSPIGEQREVVRTKDMSQVQNVKQLETKNDNTQRQQTEQYTVNKKDEKKARRARVLEYLSKTELKTIKDVSKFFTDCSEKTIQRELNDLVDDRLIVRVGDRRWSTYKLA